MSAPTASHTAATALMKEIFVARKAFAAYLIVSALADPIPVLGTDERIHLAYELQLTNGSPSKVKITGVEASASGTALQELEGDDLDDVMRVAGTTDGGGLELGPGQNATVWMDATVASDADVPDRIEHTVTASIGITYARLDEGTAVPSAEELLHQADEAMYRAKDRGKNRFMVSQRAVPTEAVGGA